MSNLRIPRDPNWAKSCVDAYEADLPDQTSPSCGFGYRVVNLKGYTDQPIHFQRNQEICAFVAAGNSIKEAAEFFELSYSQAQKIVKRGRVV